MFVNEIVAALGGGYERVGVGFVCSASTIGVMDDGSGLKLTKDQQSHNINGVSCEEISSHFAIMFSLFSGHGRILPKLRVLSRDYLDYGNK